MREYEEVLAGFRADIAAMEARARALREGWGDPDDRASTEREASRLEEEARGLRLSLADIMRATSWASGNDQEEQQELD